MDDDEPLFKILFPEWHDELMNPDKNKNTLSKLKSFKDKSFMLGNLIFKKYLWLSK